MTLWLLSFLVHSTLWLGAAWLGMRLAPDLHPRTRETVWYTAIAVSLITPTLHAVGPHQFAGLWVLPLPAAWRLPAGVVPGAAGISAAPFSALGTGWQAIAVWAWSVVAEVLLLRYWARLAMLRRWLAPHWAGERGDETRALASISRRAGLRRPPRLRESDSLGIPIAVGVGSRAAIYVPTRAFHELDQEQFGAMLGHEVAHHMRRDPVRLGFLNVLRAVLWCQPLLRVAAREVHRAAEQQCDAWAARHTDRLVVAGCLTHVAGWLMAQQRRLPAVGMAHSRSQLVARVDRLLDEGSQLPARSGVWRWLGAAVVIVAAPWLAPAWSGAGEIPPPAPVTIAAPATLTDTDHAEHAVGRDHDAEGHRGSDD